MTFTISLKGFHFLTNYKLDRICSKSPLPTCNQLPPTPKKLYKFHEIENNEKSDMF